MSAVKLACFVGLCVIISVSVVAAKGKHCEDKVQKGCKIAEGECVCGSSVGCHNPFPYKSEEECWDDIKGVNDKCKKHPCKNGACVQVNLDGKRRWHCECAGTGFYGKRCQHECPEQTEPLPEDFPVACIY